MTELVSKAEVLEEIEDTCWSGNLDDRNDLMDRIRALPPAEEVGDLRSVAARLLVEAGRQYEKYNSDTRTTKETMWILRAREEAFREVVETLGAQDYVAHYKQTPRAALNNTTEEEAG